MNKQGTLVLVIIRGLHTFIRVEESINTHIKYTDMYTFLIRDSEMILVDNWQVIIWDTLDVAW